MARAEDWPGCWSRCPVKAAAGAPSLFLPPTLDHFPARRHFPFLPTLLLPTLRFLLPVRQCQSGAAPPRSPMPPGTPPLPPSPQCLPHPPVPLGSRPFPPFFPPPPSGLGLAASPSPPPPPCHVRPRRAQGHGKPPRASRLAKASPPAGLLEGRLHWQREA